MMNLSILSYLSHINWKKFLPEIYLAIFSFLFIKWYLKLKKHDQASLVHWPIIDILPSIFLNAHRILDWTVEVSNTLGSTLVFAPLNLVYTCDPRNLEYILRTSYSNFPKGSDYKQTFEILGDGLFNSDYDLWNSQRRMAHKTITSLKVRRVIASSTHKIVKDSLLPLLEHVCKEYSVVDLEDLFLRYTFDASFVIIFGRNLKFLSISFPHDEFVEAMDEATEGLFYRHVVPSAWWKFCRRLNIGNERKYTEAWKTMDRYLHQYISEKREDVAKGNTSEETTDILEIYLRSSFNEGDDAKCYDKFLRDTSLSFLFAGRDTTGTALAWFFWLVSKNPRVESNILDELNLILSLKKSSTCEMNMAQRRVVFDTEDLKEMVYLHAALCEALRFYPSVPLNRKSALKDDLLPDGTVVKKGMLVITSTYASGRMEWVWGKDCLEFKPERWIGEDGKLNHEMMMKLFAFSVGPRICLGKEMAFVLMKSAASTMLYNFHFEVVEGQDIHPKPSIVLQMKNGLMVRVKIYIQNHGLMVKLLKVKIYIQNHLLFSKTIYCSSNHPKPSIVLMNLCCSFICFNYS